MIRTVAVHPVLPHSRTFAPSYTTLPANPQTTTQRFSPTNQFFDNAQQVPVAPILFGSRQSEKLRQYLATLIQPAGLYQTLFPKPDPIKAHQSALASKQKQLDPNHILIVKELLETGELLDEKYQWNEAVSYFQQAKEALERVSSQEKTSVMTRTLNGLAMASWRTVDRKLEETTQLLEQALTIDRELHGETHPDVSRDYNNLADVYTHDFEKAQKYIEKALAIDSQLGNVPGLIRDKRTLGGVYWYHEMWDKAEPLGKEIVALVEKEWGPYHPSLIRDLSVLAGIQFRQNRVNEAIPYLERMVHTSLMALGPSDPKVTDSLRNLGHHYTTVGRLADAERALQHALELDEQFRGTYSEDVARDLYGLSTLYEKMGKNDQSFKLSLLAKQAYRW